MHGTQVEVGLAIWVILTEEVTEGRTKVEKVFTVHGRASFDAL
jgi:hypothetical protein